MIFYANSVLSKDFANVRANVKLLVIIVVLSLSFLVEAQVWKKNFFNAFRDLHLSFPRIFIIRGSEQFHYSRIRVAKIITQNWIDVICLNHSNSCQVNDSTTAVVTKPHI